MDTIELLRSNNSQLEEIYTVCRTIDIADLKYPSKEMSFLAVAMPRMARFISEIGFDHSELHWSITRYLIDSTFHPDVRIALTATYALGDHGSRPAGVIEHLCNIVTWEKRKDDHPVVTMRAIALRILKRLDAELATQYIDSDAFLDYRNTVNHWLRTSSTASEEAIEELRSESNWIASQEHRRTKRSTEVADRPFPDG